MKGLITATAIGLGALVTVKLFGVVGLLVVAMIGGAVYAAKESSNGE